MGAPPPELQTMRAGVTDSARTGPRLARRPEPGPTPPHGSIDRMDG
jgi:hypothetical protein